MIVLNNFEVITIRGAMMATVDILDIDPLELPLLELTKKGDLTQSGDIFYLFDIPLIRLQNLTEQIIAIMVVDGLSAAWGAVCRPRASAGDVDEQ